MISYLKIKKNEMEGININKENEKNTKNLTLYENPEYKFLLEYKNILGKDITVNNIVGEGNNAIILMHPTKNDKVLKIAKPGKTDKLDIEFDNHTKFLEFLDNLKLNKNLTLKEIKIIENFYIPQVKDFSGLKGIYKINKINGLSIKSIIHLNYYKDKLNNLPTDLYKGDFHNILINFLKENGLNEKEISRLIKTGITDNDIKIFLENKGLKIYPEGKNFNKEKNKKYVSELIKERFTSNFRQNEILSFKELLEKNGFYHNDIHWGNIMIDNNGKKYLIDFGNSEIKGYIPKYKIIDGTNIYIMNNFIVSDIPHKGIPFNVFTSIERYLLKSNIIPKFDKERNIIDSIYSDYILIEYTNKNIRDKDIINNSKINIINSLKSEEIDGNKQLSENTGNFEYNGKYYLVLNPYNPLTDEINSNLGIYKGIIVNSDKYFGTNKNPKELINNTTNKIKKIID